MMIIVMHELIILFLYSFLNHLGIQLCIKWEGF